MITKEELKPFFAEIYTESNKVIEFLLLGFFIFGIGISFIFETYLVGFGVGTLAISLYFISKFLFKGTNINQYIASLVAGIFMAQFIYQMHGLFEMHFTAFVAVIALITYQNKFVFIPHLLFVVVHHSLFAYIQYIGVTTDNESYQQIYFTQLDYMDFQTFIFHAGIYALAIVLGMIYANNLEKKTIENAKNILDLSKTDERTMVNIEFAKLITEGDLNSQFQPIEDDTLGMALLGMRENLREGKKRESEEKFINIGIAETSEILRNNAGDLEELSFKLISFLVKYLESNQGGIFLLDEKEMDLELKACYAYDRKKFLEKKIGKGEGLVGQCFLEGDVIELTEIPDDYVSITSGLGESKPANLLLVPIKNDQVIEGVLEIASFAQPERFKVDFLIKICENIAGTVTSSRINAKTKGLFEKSKEQAQKLVEQEEERRQNMEELTASQEELQRKSNEFEIRLETLNTSGIGTIEFDLSGNILEANDSYCKMLNYKKEELVGKHHRTLVDSGFARSSEYKKFWKDLTQGIVQNGQFKTLNKSGQPVELIGTYSIMRDIHNKIIGIQKFAFNTTLVFENREKA
ncbi:MAG: PAS domain S-box protein [Flammeovirgaceae bacterium]|nr:PAS domain S-box protein [Flammeovirgaceae bacterium]